jgi:hypothetical protein
MVSGVVMLVTCMTGHAMVVAGFVTKRTIESNRFTGPLSCARPIK